MFICAYVQQHTKCTKHATRTKVKTLWSTLHCRVTVGFFHIKTASVMQCALCHQEGDLRRSHIIPEFMYESLYDEKHRFHVLSVIPEKASWQEQKGIRERLLCDKCEQRFSEWERYASLVLKGGIPLTHQREGNVIRVSGLDYTRFKLFQLSVLWRAGVSTLHFFQKVELGEHAEILRQLLLAGDPGSVDRYGCLMFGLKNEGQKLTNLIVPPKKVQISGHVAYRFVFGGFLWAMFVLSHSAMPQLNQCALNQTGDMTILVCEVHDLEDVNSFFSDLQKIGRLS